MVGRALSEEAKKIKNRNACNAQLWRVLENDAVNQLKPVHLHRSRTQIARYHGVFRDTLKRLAEGGRSMSAFNAEKQKLKAPEERILVDHILQSADQGFHLSHKKVVMHANSIIRSRPQGYASEKDLIDPESNWVDCFLIRHNDELQTHWSKALDMQRAQALNPTAVAH
ncbi:hypothetical protein EW146_g9648 [Bondarzewia mesenterica]|uniref:HTH CENPB-type domain-containing protein n=1 Tax=Bondarzewia mesenterica TaxID=1095465 RepID=A0A4S4L4H9_9AGAM|nr:hypothetical protein EW146_g9648 [Bondarzewia mesenterica]